MRGKHFGTRSILLAIAAEVLERAYGYVKGILEEDCVEHDGSVQGRLLLCCVRIL